MDRAESKKRGEGSREKKTREESEKVNRGEETAKEESREANQGRAGVTEAKRGGQCLLLESGSTSSYVSAEEELVEKDESGTSGSFTIR